MECWSAGVLECWSAGVLECWGVGVLGCWGVGVVGWWGGGVVGHLFCNSRTPATHDSCNSASGARTTRIGEIIARRSRRRDLGWWRRDAQ